MSNSRQMPRRGLKVLQCNLRRSTLALMEVLEACKNQEIDVALIQDPPQAVATDPMMHQGYSSIRATGPQGTRREAGILVSHHLHFTRSPETTSRAVGIEVCWDNKTIGVVSGYLQPETALGLSNLAVLCQALKAHTPLVFVGADINGHSPTWGPLETVPNALETWWRTSYSRRI